MGCHSLTDDIQLIDELVLGKFSFPIETYASHCISFIVYCVITIMGYEWYLLELGCLKIVIRFN